MTKPSERITRFADLIGTFVFAIEGSLAATLAGLDPIGVLVLGFVTALGGGVIRDLLIGATPPAAVGDWVYSLVVLVAATATWLLHPAIEIIPPMLLTTLDAAGLALFAVAGTQKSLDHGIHPLPAIFLGTVSGVGGGTIRDVLLNQVPHVLRIDIYATAALAAAVVVVLGRRLALPPGATAAVAMVICFGLRMAAVILGWHTGQ